MARLVKFNTPEGTWRYVNPDAVIGLFPNGENISIQLRDGVIYDVVGNEDDIAHKLVYAASYEPEIDVQNLAEGVDVKIEVTPSEVKATWPKKPKAVKAKAKKKPTAKKPKPKIKPKGKKK